MTHAHHNHNTLIIKCLVAAVFILSSMTRAVSPGDQNTIRPTAARGDTIIPDRWLRTYDPITVFFNSAKGPVEPVTELNPERWVSLEPAHPGGWRWLNARILQFTPSEPWPAYSTFQLRAGAASATLHTLLAGPVLTEPAQNELDVPPVEAIRLSFASAVSVDRLADNIRILLWNAPGTDGSPVRVLNRDHFTIKRAGPDIPVGQADCLLILNHPIPENVRARLVMNLTDPEDETARFVLDFTTVRQFSVLAAGAGETWLKIPLQPGEDVRFTEPLELTVNPPELSIRMSAPPEPVTLAGMWDFIHLYPTVENMQFVIQDRIIRITGDFQPDTMYQATLRPSPLIQDNRGRPLVFGRTLAAPEEGVNHIEFTFIFLQPDRMLTWANQDVIVERFGPKMLPLQGRGHHVADVRLYRINPLDRTLWPFPDETVTTKPEAMPSEQAESGTYHDQSWYPSSWDLQKTLGSLGSHQVSDVIELPLKPMGNARTYGLDLSEYLAKIDGTNAPGTYLAGVQALDGQDVRHWIRIQVTDLALTTIEEPDTVSFYVTSLRSGAPVASARVTLEGYSGGNWTRVISGQTDAMGLFREARTGDTEYYVLKRIRVEHGSDILVLNTDKPPELFRNGYWQKSGDWLYGAVNYPNNFHRIGHAGHTFTERPVYRPGEPVHIRGWIRDRTDGRLALAEGNIEMVIDGPGDLSWTQSLKLNSLGAFYHRFQQPDAPSGLYRVSVMREDETVSTCRFRLEDYRIPRFEVLLHGDDTVSLDTPFNVSLTARYYAGGAMENRPVSWRVTQHPAAWHASGLPGFKFAVDDRFTSRPGLRENEIVHIQRKTDATGGSEITIDPLEDASLAPRNYVIEATVTGPDGQTATAVKQVAGRPPFMLGINTSRVLNPGNPILSQVVLLNPEGNPEPGMDMTVRLIRRTWHTALKAGNYGSGDLKYETHTVETPLATRTVISGDKPLEIVFPVTDAGVYIVEASARDKAGRLQRVAMDVFVQGPEPVTWERAPDRRFSLRTDKPVYETGETARLLIESPFQTAEAVAVIESPDGLQFFHSAVRNGTGIIQVPVIHIWCPKVAVSVLLMRGRLEGTQLDPVSGVDLGKPQTLGTAVDLHVSESRYAASVELTHPDRALPGETIDVFITLRDSSNRPVEGEAAVWLVDRAVLALGREPDPNPLKDLLKPFGSHIGIRDTRELVTGRLPGIFTSGGDFGEDMTGDIFDRMSIRRKFVPVPFYEPFVVTGPDGRAKVTVELPDNVTEFAVRAKACSGVDRFGFAESRLAVRLPLVVQPTVPRFLRPGDTFDAKAVTRVVEGNGGPGQVALRHDGLELRSPAVYQVDWTFNQPLRTVFSLNLPHSGYDREGRLKRDNVSIQLAAERKNDGAGDAVETALPVYDGVRDWADASEWRLGRGDTITVPGIDRDLIRSDTARRAVRISTSPLIITAFQAESMLRDYPYGCTEQQVSRAAGFLAAKRLRSTLNLPVEDARYDGVIQGVIEYLPAVIAPDGLVSFWPGNPGYVHLTARTLRFLGDARTGGFEVDPLLVEKLVQALKNALRSDSALLADGYEIEERVMALEVLMVFGQGDIGYIEEMTRRAEQTGVETRARIIRLFAGLPNVDESRLTALVEGLLDGVVIQSVHGRPVAVGLHSGFQGWQYGFMSDVTALAEVMRTLNRVNPGDHRIQSLSDGIAAMIATGRMTTYHAASVLAAVSELLESGRPSTGETRLELGGRVHVLNSETPFLVVEDTGDTDCMVRVVEGAEVYIQAGYHGKPVAAPAEQPGESAGFAVQRHWSVQIRDDRAGRQVSLDSAGEDIEITEGAVVEEHIRIVNPEDRYYVVVYVPVAAGMEPLNPHLAISPPEAVPAGRITRPPDYLEMRDHYVAYYYNSLPRGTYDFYFRTKAEFSGRFTQPGAYARMMYNLEQAGASPGVYVSISAAE